MPSIRALCLLISGLALAACSLGSETSIDETPPLVRIDAPVNNATVGLQVPIEISAVDDFGVDKVRVLIDGVLLTEVFSPPFRASWNSLTVANNTVHVIRVEAVDLAKHVASDVISVTVVNGQQSPPAVPR